MRLRLALARLVLVVGLVGTTLAQDNNGGNPADNGGNTGGGNDGNGGGNNGGNGGNNGGANGNNNSNAGGSNGGNSTSPSARPSGSASSGGPSATSNAIPGDVVATTVTSLLAGPSGTQTATFVFTFTVGGQNRTEPSNNGTMSNSTDTDANATANATTGWNDTLSYLPFKPKLDPAYGVGGALLILSGIPTAVLGGKSRWSALAIVSGYSVGLFTLVIILSFGVSPALEPPSPDPPTTAMRGLYLLAVGISCLVGAGIGIFFYHFAKYWVGAAGGFCLGWFLLALRKGGTVHSVGPRWAILGGLTVIVFMASLWSKIHEVVLLAASAFVGATAFTLGVDCFTRAGLKEFYIYNLGYPQLFPSLNGGKFPLTQSMQVEIGVMVAVALIAAAIQFKLVAVLKERRKRIVEAEEANREAEAVALAAENFKNVDAELAEWEGKHGEKGGSGRSPRGPRPNLPTLGYQPPLDSPSTLVGPASSRKEYLSSRMSLLEEMGVEDGPASPHHDDPEMGQKLQLLADVRRARRSIRSSMDQLRASEADEAAPRSSSSAYGSALEQQVASPGSGHSRHNSSSSSGLVDARSRHDSNSSSRLLDDTRVRHNSGASSRLLDDDGVAMARRSSLGSRALVPGDSPGLGPGTRHSLAEASRPLLDRTSSDVLAPNDRPHSTSNVDWEARNAEWDQYVKSRNVVTMASPPPALTRRSSDFAVVSGGVARAVSNRNERNGPRPPEPSAGKEYGTQLMRALSSDAQRHSLGSPPQGVRRVSNDRSPRAPRAMTTEELAERHRNRLSRMQDQVSGPIREEIALAEAREAWSKKQGAEREEQQRRDRGRERKPSKAERGDTAREKTVGDALTNRAQPSSSERKRRTEEWRSSVALSPPKASAALPTSPKKPTATIPDKTTSTTKAAGTSKATPTKPQASRRTSKANLANIA